MVDRSKMTRTTKQTRGRGSTEWRAPSKSFGSVKARAPEGPGGGRVSTTKTTRTSDMKRFKNGSFTQIRKHRRK